MVWLDLLCSCTCTRYAININRISLALRWRWIAIVFGLLCSLWPRNLHLSSMKNQHGHLKRTVLWRQHRWLMTCSSCRSDIIVKMTYEWWHVVVLLLLLLQPSALFGWFKTSNWSCTWMGSWWSMKTLNTLRQLWDRRFEDFVGTHICKLCVILWFVRISGCVYSWSIWVGDSP